MSEFIDSLKYTNESIFLRDIYKYYYGIRLSYGESSKFYNSIQGHQTNNFRAVKIFKDLVDRRFNNTVENVVIETNYQEDNIIEVLYKNMLKYLHFNEAYKYTLYSDNYTKAIEIYENIFSLEPSDFNIVNINSYIQLIMLYYETNQHDKLSILNEFFKSAAFNKRLHDNSIIYFCLGVYSMLTKIEKDTLKCFNKALNIKESFLFILKLTDMLDIPDGIKVIEFGIFKYPNYLPLKLEFCKRLTSSINIVNNENTYVIQERILKECLKDNLQLPLLYNELGSMYLKIERIDDAIKLFKEGLRVIDNLPIILNSKEPLIFNLASSYFKLNNFNECINLLLKIDSKNIDVYIMIGMCYHSNKDFTNAYNYYSKALVMDSKNIIVKECINKLVMS